MSYKIYFYEAFEEEQAALKRYLPESIKAGFTRKTIQETDHLNPPANIISIRTQSIFPTDWANNISAIISRSTGFDHLKLYQKNTGTEIVMGYLPKYCHRAVAEHALMMWLSLMRKLPKQIDQFITFSRDGLSGLEMSGKTLAVYGVGNIGYQICNIGQVLHMNVLGVDIVKRYPDINYSDPQTAAKKADIIVAAMNLTDENKNYFNSKFWLQVKPYSIFINISRGELSPSGTLLNALRANQISAVGLDVFNQEKQLADLLRNNKPSKDDEISALKELMKMENVLLTPHNAFNTEESVERKARQTIEQLNFFLENNRFKWQVG